MGNPLGLFRTVTIGIISALGRSELNIIEQGYESFIQTDAAINPGGALVDAPGGLIGILTAIQSNFSGGNIGMGFAIPSRMALSIVQRLLDGGGVIKRGFLGVFLRDLDENMDKAHGQENTTSVLVAEVGEKTPGEAAGTKQGGSDRRVCRQAGHGHAATPPRYQQHRPGSEVNFEVISKGKKTDLKVNLGGIEDNEIAAPTPGRSDRSRNEDLIDGVVVDNLEKETRSRLQLSDLVKGASSIA